MRQKLQLLVPFRPLVVATILVFLLGATNSPASPKRPPKPQPQGCSAWSDDFSSPKLNQQLWVVANGQAPGYIPGVHIGYYDPSHVSIEKGYLKIQLTQQTGLVDGSNGIISDGGLVYTKMTCGYGTYQWTMRMSSTSNTPGGSGAWESGSVSAGFLYVNNSQTEIDFEYSALSPEDVWAVNWYNTNTHRDPTDSMETADAFEVLDATATFHTYKFVWAPGVITFYKDGDWVATHTTNVPSAPAYFMINHWGTNSTRWGGIATPNVSRYFYVDSVSYTPPQ